MNSDGLTQLAERVAKIEAREDIRTLVARYGMAIDDRDVQLVGQLFTPDGVFRQSNDMFVSKGRAAIVEYYTTRLQSYGTSYHYPHSHVIEFQSPVEATGVVSAHAELGVDGTTFTTALRYHDRYAVDDGEWKFKERTILMMYYMSVTDFADGGMNETDRKRYFGDIGPADIPESLATWKAFVGED